MQVFGLDPNFFFRWWAQSDGVRWLGPFSRPKETDSDVTISTVRVARLFGGRGFRKGRCWPFPPHPRTYVLCGSRGRVPYRLSVEIGSELSSVGRPFSESSHAFTRAGQPPPPRGCRMGASSTFDSNESECGNPLGAFGFISTKMITAWASAPPFRYFCSHVPFT